MCKFWDKLTGNYSSSAKVVDNHLILSLPDAISPVVWRMELTDVKASALEIRDGEDSEHCLILKTPKGEIHEIAPFEVKTKALKALMAVSEAMERGETHNTENLQKFKSQKPSAVNENSHGAAKWVAAFVGVLIVSGMIVYLGSLTPTTAGTGSTAASTVSPASGDTNQTGVPLSADAYLGGF